MLSSCRLLLSQLACCHAKLPRRFEAVMSYDSCSESTVYPYNLMPVPATSGPAFATRQHPPELLRSIAVAWLQSGILCCNPKPKKELPAPPPTCRYQSLQRSACLFVYRKSRQRAAGTHDKFPKQDNPAPTNTERNVRQACLLNAHTDGPPAALHL